MEQAMTTRFITGLSEIIDGYDALFVDLWGCVVDGITAFPEAVDCLRTLRASGRKIVLLTNVPRPTETVRERIEDIGVAPDCYDAMVTSGDATIHALNSRDDPWHAAFGTRYFHIGANANDPLLSEIDGSETTDIADADYILVTGFRSRNNDTPERYADVFDAAIARNLPLVCANPDRMSSHGDRIVYRAGAVAEAYERRGGPVRYHGKPDAGIYRLGFAHMGGVDPKRVLMVGDNLATDIVGAHNAGLDALWIAGGLHAEEVGLHADAPLDPQRIREVLERTGAAPEAVAAKLRYA
jgi:HAD superfamily hydrolase (TIGR01459 family)